MTLRSASSHSWSPQLKWDLLRSSGRGKQEKTKKSTFYNFLNSFTYTRGMINSWTFPVTEILKRGLCVNYRIFDLITIYFTRNLSYLSLNCNCNIVNVCKNFLIHDRPFTSWGLLNWRDSLIDFRFWFWRRKGWGNSSFERKPSKSGGKGRFLL